MTLQSSGAISLANIQTEFGGSNPIGINEYYGVAAGVPASGTISLNDFYGKSAAVAFVWTTDIMGYRYSSGGYIGGDAYTSGPTITPGSGASPVTFNITMVTNAGSDPGTDLNLYVGGSLNTSWIRSPGYYNFSHTSYFGSSSLRFTSIIYDYNTNAENNFISVYVGATRAYYHYLDNWYID